MFFGLGQQYLYGCISFFFHTACVFGYMVANGSDLVFETMKLFFKSIVMMILAGPAIVINVFRHAFGQYSFPFKKANNPTPTHIAKSAPLHEQETGERRASISKDCSGSLDTIAERTTVNFLISMISILRGLTAMLLFVVSLPAVLIVNFAIFNLKAITKAVDSVKLRSKNQV